MSERTLQAYMESHGILEITNQRLGDGRLRRKARFASATQARTYKQSGQGGRTLGVYWYSAEWTPSQIMRDCPDSGHLES